MDIEGKGTGQIVHTGFSYIYIYVFMYVCMHACMYGPVLCLLTAYA